jgi:DNA segregation ATPase FtsK/SpoIIIE, S-DNA-T family
VIWSLLRAFRDGGGWMRVWALDAKRMELSFGRSLFDRYACQAADMVDLLEAAVRVVHERAARFGGCP